MLEKNLFTQDTKCVLGFFVCNDVQKHKHFFTVVDDDYLSDDDGGRRSSRRRSAAKRVTNYCEDSDNSSEGSKSNSYSDSDASGPVKRKSPVKKQNVIDSESDSNTKKSRRKSRSSFNDKDSDFDPADYAEEPPARRQKKKVNYKALNDGSCSEDEAEETPYSETSEESVVAKKRTSKNLIKWESDSESEECSEEDESKGESEDDQGEEKKKETDKPSETSTSNQENIQKIKENGLSHVLCSDSESSQSKKDFPSSIDSFNGDSLNNGFSKEALANSIVSGAAQENNSGSEVAEDDLSQVEDLVSFVTQDL